MRILDLDLDFFIDDIAIYRWGNSPRLSDEEYHPWTDQEVINYLENHCNLLSNNKIRGKSVIHHHEAFLYWRDLIDRGELEIPFEVVHIDAHSDLGYPAGDDILDYVLTELTYLPLNLRINDILEKNRLNISNYLLFAAACGWINKITYVTHPKAKYPRDLHGLYLKENRASSGFLQLKRYSKEQFKQVMSLKDIKPEGFDLEIPLEIIPYDEYKNVQPFSFIVLSQSPGYTPKSADSLIKIITQYIELDY